MSEQEIIAVLKGLSAADCLSSLAHVSTRLFAATGPSGTREALQLQLVSEVLGDGAPGKQMQHRLRADPRRVAFFEQQLVHLARLVILHADRRPHDDFESGASYVDWVRACLFGVTDLLDALLDPEDREARLGWEIRQSVFNHHEDTVPVVGIHHEIYRVLWDEPHDSRAVEASAAFERSTGLTIADYFTVGSTVLARLVNRGDHEGGLPAISPESYFSTATFAPDVWRAFFRLNARSVDVLRTELENEAHRYGLTTYGSLAFERFPLIEVESGTFFPVSMRSLQRRITEGVFHILSEAAVADGKDRRYYSSAFGPVFQRSVEQTLRRATEATPVASPITADVLYGSRKRRRRSSDVMLGYERNPVFVEVVSGPLQAGSLTRGDLACFSEDVRRLIVEKARQLDRCIQDFFADELQLEGVSAALVTHVWPVIVTSHYFPQSPPIQQFVDTAVREQGYLQDERIGPLAVVSAEELSFCEGFAQQGRPFLSVIRGWKDSHHADWPIRNYLIELGDGRMPPSSHFTARFAEATAEHMNRTLGTATNADALLGSLGSARRGAVDGSRSPDGSG